MSRRAAPASRGIVPVTIDLPESVLIKQVRQDPATGNVSLSDCVQNVSSGYEASKRLISRHFDPKKIGAQKSPLEETMSLIGFEPSDVSYVRWSGARGPHDSIVAPLNVAVAFLLQLNTRGAAELRGAAPCRIVSASRRRRPCRSRAASDRRPPRRAARRRLPARAWPCLPHCRSSPARARSRARPHLLEAQPG